MIRIKINKLRVRKKNDLAEIIDVDAKNIAASIFADNLKKDVKNFKCEDCENWRLTIIISAHRNKKMTVKKTGFCCKKFVESIEIDIK